MTLFPVPSLRAKLWISLGGLFFILLVGSAISAVVLTRFSRELQRLLRENYDSEVFCDEMIGALDRLDAAARQQAWNEAGENVDIATQRSRFDDNLTRQLHNVSLPGEWDESQHLSSDWGKYRAEFDLLVADEPRQRQRRYSTNLLPIYRDARFTAQRIAALNMRNVVAADGRVRANMLEVRDALLGLVGIGAALALIVLGASGANLLQPLQDLTRSARRIGSGDLDLTVPIRSRDEIGQLAEAFNVMASQLREYRKLDHDRLLRAQHTTQLAIDSLPDAVIVFSPDGVVENSNRTAVTHFAAETGKRIGDLKLDWLSVLHAQIARGLEPPDPRGYASAVQLFDQGRERFLLPRGVPMLDDAGRVVGVTIILADVTALRQADEFKSGLVSTVSHELRTPLTSMRMSTLLLADETLGPLNVRQRKLVEAARDESERLYQIIESLLEFSRAQATAGKTAVIPVVVKHIVAGALAPLATGFAEKSITPQLRVDDGLAVLVDERCAISVISNLLSNALKFTPVGGVVVITAERVNERGGGNIALSVRDSGCGVPAEFSERIFERFFRVPGQTSISGSGLGLAIARQIAEAQGGTVSYSPGDGGGSIFRFTVPAADHP